MAGISTSEKESLDRFRSVGHRTQLGTKLYNQLPDTDEIAGLSANSPSAANPVLTEGEFEVVGNITDNAPDNAAAAGTNDTVARGDHQHATPCATAVGLTSSSTSTEGDSTSLSRANHTHAVTGLLSAAELAGVVANSPSAGNPVTTQVELLEATRNLDKKDSVRLATTAALPACTAAGSGVGKTLTGDAVGQLADIDGVTPAAGDRILVQNQVASEDNGIYTVTTLGDGGTAFVLTRAVDADADSEVTAGMMVPVTEGTLNADQVFFLTTNDPITLDTTGLTFAVNARLLTAAQLAGVVANSPTTANPLQSLTEIQELGGAKDPVRAATTAALPACTAAGTGIGKTLTGNANGALAAQDGVTLVDGDRLLVQNQVALEDNGIYVITQIGTAGTPFILTRAVDADTAAKLYPGFLVPVQEGTVNAAQIMQLRTAAPIVLETDSVEFGLAGGYTVISAIRNENTDGKIPCSLKDAVQASGTWTTSYDGTGKSYKTTRTAAAASEVCAVPLNTPGLRTTALKGRKITGIRIAYQNSGDLAVDCDADVFERPLPANGANAHANGASLKGSATYDADHDTAAKRYATGNHCMEITFEVPAYLDGGELTMEFTANDTGGAGTATTTISGVELVYDETLVD